MGETWYKEYCPKCNSHNWINNGDTTDLSQLDIEAIKCRKCEHIFYLGTEEDFKLLKEISGWETIEDCNWEIGLTNPR